MKLQPDIAEGVNVIKSHDAGAVRVNDQTFTHSILVPATGEVVAWPASDVSELTEAHFAQIAAAQPELVIFGSGPTLRFPSPALLRSLMAARIGVETMDTAAACRTYNILVGEGRKAMAALLIKG
jgi:uncharacterized protein